MKSMLFKDIFREIRLSLNRFLSIFAIVAIGVSFFAGIKATGQDMKLTADKYYDDYNLMDIHLLSSIGFNNDDIDAVKKVDGVEGVYPSYSMDAMTNINDKDLVLKVLALPIDKQNTQDPSYINRVKLVEGRLPEKSNECVTEKGKIINSGMNIGCKITLSSGNEKNISDSLKINEFTIVGIVETPYYVSFERGTSPIGNGKINNFIMVPQYDFKIPAYTDMFLTVKGAKSRLSYNDEYKDTINIVKTAIEDAGRQRSQIRYDEIIKTADEELDARKKELSDAEEKQGTELADANQRLEDSRERISEGENELSNRKVQFNKEVSDAKAKIADSETKLSSGEEQYNEQLQAYNNAKEQSEKEFAKAQYEIDIARDDISKEETSLNQLKAALASGLYTSPEQKAAMEASIASGQKQLDSAKAQLEASESQLIAKKKQLDDAGTALDDMRKTLDFSRVQLNTQKNQLDNMVKTYESQFKEAELKLDSSRKEIEQGEKDYEDSKKESDAKIADAKEKITAAESDINKIGKPKWYVLDRDTNPGFVDFGQAAERMDAIAQVFPVFFFLVAALVCLTTMTRMVDEQRNHIGVFKALGYSKISIASKYLLYAVTASLGGSISGFLIGFKLFPSVIYNAYGIMYTLPPVITEFNTFYAVVSTSFAVLATTLAAFFACSSELMVTPASLMRPKAPKTGKRIFLEKILFIWKRLNFIQKVTARNLFRYKKRFLMTVLGIGGCTALLLSGFGLKDSIMSIVTKQFDYIYKYNMVIGLKDGISSGQAIELADSISKDTRIIDYMFMREQSIDVYSGGMEKSVSLVVPESTDRMKNFIVLKSRISGKDVPFTDDGVILTEKLSNMLHAGVGDTIYIKNENLEIPVKVSGITENYVYHYIYMSPVLYKSVYGDSVKFQELIARTPDTSENFENKLSTDLLKYRDVRSISFLTGISKNFNNIIGSLNYIVLVLIISAGALAFVVLYNLTNINVSERLREIATIKVLGFYNNEVSSYIYRENFLLTLAGMGLGLVLGIFLHRYVVVTAEVDYVMFGRDIKPLSYVYSAILTILFSGFVNLIIYFRLKRIKMVESLKSVD